MSGGPPSGVQQPAGSLSDGRFSMNSFPSALSQLSHARSHDHSGVTNRQGSEVSPIFNMGPQITNSLGDLVDGGNFGRSSSSGGGINMSGLAPRLNLMGNGGSANTVQGSNNLIGGVLSQAPQVLSMLGNSYSPAGAALSRNQVKLGNNHLSSMSLLNGLSAHENAPFDINDFRQLNGRLNSAAGSQGQPGSVWKQSVGVLQQNREFRIQNEDFPALPGYKGGNTDDQVDMRWKEQFHDNDAMGRSSGFNIREPYSSHHQQQQHHAPSLSGGRASFLHGNNQDFLHLHGSDLLPSSHSSYPSPVRSGGPSTIGLRPINSSNKISGEGSYDQVMQQYQQLQSQSQYRLQEMLATGPYRIDDLKSTQGPQAVTDRFGLLGLLSIVKMSNSHLASLALGIDLTTLGLNLNSSHDLHKKFSSPWSEEPAKGEPQYSLPECYYAKQPPALHQGYFSKFKLETLFYIFYSMPKEEAQLCAANELINRGWFYHRELRLWFLRDPKMEPLVKTNTYERGTYFCFNPNTWGTVCKENFVLQYEMIEKRPTLPQH